VSLRTKSNAVSTKALVVEDDPTFRAVVAMVVTELGFEVTAVGDGGTALRISSQNRLNF
jgi:CheY-like chemotaxis protein